MSAIEIIGLLILGMVGIVALLLADKIANVEYQIQDRKRELRK